MRSLINNVGASIELKRRHDDIKALSCRQVFKHKLSSH